MAYAPVVRVEREQKSLGSIRLFANSRGTIHRVDSAQTITMRPLRILMVASEGPPTHSGMARTIQRLRDGLRLRGHRVDVISYPGVRRASFGEVRLSSLLFQLPQIARRLVDYDLIHVHGAAPTVSDVFLAFARAARLRQPIVYTHHSDMQVSWGGPLNTLYNAFHCRLTAGVDELVSTTQGYASEVGLKGNTSVIPLGVDLAATDGSEAKDSHFTVLFVGQFRPYKGVPVLLEAMARVHGGRLLIAGSGPEEHAYRQLAAQLGVNVEFFVGAADEQLRQLYRRAHALVLPSVTRAEAFGLVLLESMAAGCVPVASDLAGVRDVLGRIGFTFPAHSVDGLAATLRHLRDNPTLVVEVGTRARKRAALFSWDRTLSDYERLFRDLLTVRELRQNLLGERRLDAAPMHTFLRNVATNLQGERAEIFLRGTSGPLRRVASSAELEMTNCLIPQEEVAHTVGQYACESGEGVLLTSDTVPRPLAELHNWGASAIAAPFTTKGQRFGAAVVMRERPFDRRDLESLTRLARHAAPVLYVSEQYEQVYAARTTFVAGQPRPYGRRSPARMAAD